MSTARGHSYGVGLRRAIWPFRSVIALVLAYALAFGAMLGPSHGVAVSTAVLALEQCGTDAASTGNQPASPHDVGHDQCCLAACTPLALLMQDPDISSVARSFQDHSWRRDIAGLPFGFPSSATSQPRAPPVFV
jgi:hypothetical protein